MVKTHYNQSVFQELSLTPQNVNSAISFKRLSPDDGFEVQQTIRKEVGDYYEQIEIIVDQAEQMDVDLSEETEGEIQEALDIGAPVISRPITSGPLNYKTVIIPTQELKVKRRCKNISLTGTLSLGPQSLLPDRFIFDVVYNILLVRYIKKEPYTANFGIGPFNRLMPTFMPRNVLLGYAAGMMSSKFAPEPRGFSVMIDEDTTLNPGDQVAIIFNFYIIYNGPLSSDAALQRGLLNDLIPIMLANLQYDLTAE